jgi:hypothetical protein
MGMGVLGLVTRGLGVVGGGVVLLLVLVLGLVLVLVLVVLVLAVLVAGARGWRGRRWCISSSQGGLGR